ncbi:unnamed protein product [Schistosoma intercalatum]|nr:unnamed protein product [Schistosoma intercalatum]
MKEKMRHIFSCDLVIRLFLTLNLFSKDFDCGDICKQPKYQHLEKVIFENESYQYSLHYSYLRRISHIQSHPVVNGSFSKTRDGQTVTPKFLFKYYDTHVKSLVIYSFGLIRMYGVGKFGQIVNFIPEDFQSEFEILNDMDFIAARWFYVVEHNNTRKSTFNYSLIAYEIYTLASLLIVMTHSLCYLYLLRNWEGQNLVHFCKIRTELCVKSTQHLIILVST